MIIFDYTFCRSFELKGLFDVTYRIRVKVQDTCWDWPWDGEARWAAIWHSDTETSKSSCSVRPHLD